ncbi:hypothetical protein niasHT_028400 [Heterodera trifolii]|uniref:MATH domain-containing protein n=1 Tax=Heterodera trifolii TaxID=157864 RepID=A0ABD2JJ08_9BILA
MSHHPNEKCLGFNLLCGAREEGPWNRICSTIFQFVSGNIDAAIGTLYWKWSFCVYSATFRIVSQKKVAENSTGTLMDRVFDKKKNWWGFSNFISFAELMDPSNGFYNREKDKVTLAIDLTVKKEKIYKINQCKTEGTLFMEIKKMSEFAREVFLSERKSDTVTYIKGLRCKILAQINQWKGTDNKKYLGIFLLCTAPTEENWSFKCSAIIRIVSQKFGVTDFRREFDAHIINNGYNDWGFSRLITLTDLMDPIYGFYNKNEDKVTLAIDVTVNEAKRRTNHKQFAD